MKWYVVVETQADGKNYVGICEYYGGEESQEGFIGLHDSESEADAACIKYAQEQGLPLFADYREVIIYRKYFDEEKAERVVLQEAVERLEGRGYYKPGTVKKLLQTGETLQTNAAEYYSEKPARANTG